MVRDVVADVANARHVQSDSLNGSRLAVFKYLEIILGKAGDYLVLLKEGVPVHPKMRAVEHDHRHDDFEGFHSDWGSVCSYRWSKRRIIGEC
jgi:hypothetical protein